MDTNKQMMPDDATTRLRMESFHSEYDSQTISNEELHQKLEEDIHETLKIGPFSVWALGITIVIGGQYFSWNEGLTAGFGSELLSVFLMGSAYICLCLCNAELTSSLPFAGGAYGLARVTLGLFPGFLIGCCEAMEYMIYVASSTIFLSEILTTVSNAPNFIIPIYSLVIYVVACGILIIGGSIFWQISSIVGVLSLLILLVFCFGSIPFTNFTQNAPSPGTTGSLDFEPSYFIGGVCGFLKVLPLAAWFFVGVESLNLTASVVLTPKTTIPRGSIACVVTLFVCSILVLFVTSSLRMSNISQVPIAYSETPFSLGFSLMFNISEDVAIIFSIPATFATAYGFIFAYSRVLIAMARSLLLPSFLLRTYGKYHTPYVAILIGSILGYGLCIIVFFFPDVDGYLFTVCILSAFLAYISQFIGYVIFKMKYDQHERKFTSPVGIFGALYGGLIFSVGAIAVCFFQDDTYINMKCMTVLCAVYTLIYFCYSKKRQSFSSDEKIFFPVHVVKFNDRKRLMARKGKKRGLNSHSLHSVDNCSVKSPVYHPTVKTSTVSVSAYNDRLATLRIFKGSLLKKFGSIFIMNSTSKTVSTSKILCENDSQYNEKNCGSRENNWKIYSKNSYEISKMKNSLNIKYELYEQINQKKLTEKGKENEEILKNLEASVDEFHCLHNEMKNNENNKEIDKTALTSLDNSLYIMRCSTYSAHELDSYENRKNGVSSDQNKSVKSNPDVENEIRVLHTHSLTADRTDLEKRNFLLFDNTLSHYIDNVDDCNVSILTSSS